MKGSSYFLFSAEMKRRVESFLIGEQKKRTSFPSFYMRKHWERWLNTILLLPSHISGKDSLAHKEASLLIPSVFPTFCLVQQVDRQV